MTSASLFRWSGLALLLGGSLVAISQILAGLLFSTNDLSIYSQPLFFPTYLLTLFGAAFVLLGLPGLYAQQAGKVGWMGLVGFVCTFCSLLVIGIGAGIVVGFVVPFLAQEAPKITSGSGPPALNVLIMVTSLLFVVGAILLGLATMRAQVLPRWAGLLLIISGVMNLVPIAPLPTTLSNIIGDAAGAVFALGLVWIGMALWSTKSQNLESGATVGQMATS